MHYPKSYYFFVLLLVLPIVLLHTTGCQKDYSYEGGDTTAIIGDSTVPPPLTEFPNCSSCKVTDELTLAKWNFKTGNSYLCGGVDKSGFIGVNKTFTFFGPSACSIDTGLVMTVYLPIALDQDRFNIITNRAAFYYYDNNAPKDIFISQATALFTVNLQSFIYATGIATGTFNGTVFKPNGDTAYIADGKFKVKLR
ncbi:MAG TPA: hypothetical protein VIL78_00325 [Hanamia sp.]